MVAALQKKISESATARWSVLALVAFTMLCGYFITDVMAPLKNGTAVTMGSLPVHTVGLMYSC